MKIRAFSLIELAAALAITAIAVIGILSLLSTALQSARDSQDETRSALIARMIFSDLAASRSTNALVATDSTSVPTGFQIDLATPASHHTAYSSSGQPLAKVDEAAFVSGVLLPAGSAYLAQISILRDISPFPKLRRIQVILETPAQAPSPIRNRFIFVTDVGLP